MLFGAQNALAGMQTSQKWADCVADNLANINTNSFKAQKASFSQHLVRALSGEGRPITKEPPQAVGMGSDVFFKKNWQQGNLIKTGSSLDLALEGSGFLAVRMADGTTAYIRGGNFKINENGELTTAEGYFLLPEISLGENFQEVTITPEGQIIVEDSEGERRSVGELEVYLASNPDNLLTLGEGLFVSSEPLAGGRPGEGERGLIRQGYLETSNVDISSEFTDLVILQRMQQFNARSMSVADNMWQMVNELRS